MNEEDRALIEQVVQDLTPDPAQVIHDKIREAFNKHFIGQPNTPQVQLQAQGVVQQILAQYGVPSTVEVDTEAQGDTLHLKIRFEVQAPDVRIIEARYGYSDR